MKEKKKKKEIKDPFFDQFPWLNALFTSEEEELKNKHDELHPDKEKIKKEWEKYKKNCCKSYKKGKQCKRCPLKELKKP